jgi:hypothetical protein
MLHEELYVVIMYCIENVDTQALTGEGPLVHAMYRGAAEVHPQLLTSVLDAGDCSTSCPGHFKTKEMTCSNHCVGE